MHVEDVPSECSSNLKKFECKICGERFEINNVLKQYLVSKHVSTDTYECEECENIFVEEMNLKSHTKKVHGFDTENLCEATFHNPSLNVEC